MLYIIHYTCTDTHNVCIAYSNSSKINSQCTAKRSNSRILKHTNTRLFIQCFAFVSKHFSRILPISFTCILSNLCKKKTKNKKKFILIEMKNVYSRNRVCSCGWKSRGYQINFIQQKLWINLLVCSFLASGFFFSSVVFVHKLIRIEIIIDVIYLSNESPVSWDFVHFIDKCMPMYIWNKCAWMLMINHIK